MKRTPSLAALTALTLFAAMAAVAQAQAPASNAPAVLHGVQAGQAAVPQVPMPGQSYRVTTVQTVQAFPGSVPARAVVPASAVEEGAYEDASFYDEFQGMKAQLAAQAAELEALRSGAYGGCGCGGCCDGCGCDPCRRSQGFYFGGELLWLKPHNTGGTGSDAMWRVDAEIDNMEFAQIDTLDTEFDPSYRLWFGYQRCDGLGIRARYWEFDQEYAIADANPDENVTFLGVTAGSGVTADVVLTSGALFTNFHAWDTYVFDLEATDSSKVGCNWDMTLSAGLRYVDYAESTGIIDEEPGQIDALISAVNISGIGLTTGLEFRRQVTCSLGAYVGARWSLILGDEINKVFDPINDAQIIAVDQRNDAKFMYEGQAGLEYLLPICEGGYYFLRGGVEIQYWDSFGVDHVAWTRNQEFTEFENGSVAFGGFSISAGLQR